MSRNRFVIECALQSALLVAGLLTVFPFLWMLMASFKPSQEIFQPGLHLLPQRFTFENYLVAFSRAPLERYLLNGVLVCTGILVGQILVIVPAGYAFARLTFPGRDTLFAITLAALVVPGYVTSIPNFLLLAEVELLDTYWALVLPFLGSAFGVFLMRQFFHQLPGEILDAARLDGANSAQLIWHVVLPLTRPALAAFGIFSLVAHWNDLFWPLVVIRSAELYTPPAGIAYFADAEGAGNWGVVMAAAVTIVAPLLTLFVIASKQFIQGVSYSALKG